MLKVARTAIAARSSNVPYLGSCDMVSQLPISGAERSSAMPAATNAHSSTAGAKNTATVRMI